jgi:hypothetical protein
MAPTVLTTPRGPDQEEYLLIEQSLAHPAHPVPEETRERGQCSGCGTKAKTLTAPAKVGHGYQGPMYCLPCNPRFLTLDAQWSSLERMV